MSLFKWSAGAALFGALIINGGQQSMAGDGWRLFRHRSTNSDTNCQSAACATTASTSTREAVPAEAASVPPQNEVGTAAVQSAPAPVMFAAPPAGGTILGEQNRLGFRGAGFTIPEIHMELPTLHLPSIVRSRRNPEMQLDGGRAPMVNSAPAAYGQIANAGVIGQHQFASASIPASPASTPARPAAAASTKPGVSAAPVESCVPPTPTYINSTGALSTSPDDVVEMRRTLIAYQQELARLSRALDAASANNGETQSQADLPPSPDDSPIRRLSYTQPRKEKTLGRKQPQRIVETSQDDEYEQDEMQRSRSRAGRVSEVTAPKSGARVTTRIRKVEEN